MSDKHFLFVAGAPRSGTTALTHALNSIDNVQVGSEIFPHVIQPERHADFGEQLFSMENLESTLSRWMEPEAAQAALQAFANSQVIGDKHPHYHRLLARMQTNFPNFYLIMIYRDILPVAKSFQQRYLDKSHVRWNLDESKALHYWFKAAENFLNFKMQAPGNALLISYEALFEAQPKDATSYFCRIHAAMNRFLPLGPIDHSRLMAVFDESAGRRKKRAGILNEGAEMKRLFESRVAINGKYSIEGYQRMKQEMDKAASELKD
jgi:hypothetical protein